MRRLVSTLGLVGLLAAVGCPSKRPSARRVRSDAGVEAVRPRARPALAAPRPVPHTAAQRAFDQPHRAAFLRILAELRQLFSRSLSLQARGVREPATRDDWPAEREKLVAAVGRVKARVLAVDPLANRSWAAAQALVLVRYLTVALPDAIRESWRPRPSGAFVTYKSDFRLIWRRLQRYVDHKLNSAPPGRPKDSR